MLTVVNADGATSGGSSLLDDIVREGARRMLAAALEAEVTAYIAELVDERDQRGRLVVRNGYHQPREVTTAAGVVEVKAQRVNDKRVDADTGERKRFSSAILPPWCRKSPKISEVLPLLSLHGLSSGDFVPALEQFLGTAAGLSPATVNRLTQQWQADHTAFLDRDCARRGMRAPVLAVGDGALGFWNALAEVFPASRHQRCWVHKSANVLNALPKSAQPGARKALQDICNAEVRDHAVQAIKTFAWLYGAKFPKAAKKITDDEAELLAFFDFSAEHWIHLRTTNPIESTFATVRLRTKVTRGAGSRTAALAMVFEAEGGAVSASAGSAGGPMTSA
ncbi:hypothetical protein GCM10010260_81060 [Streptomyces filipinensis]|uniref:Mutator family transposase n=1 Tax=Streptomyces filipinensis TaxID=66887 RepID=A0A918IK00_9ACTN|nr:hypothetical protein GCM10010260_81060 [Streptomyces filipinensis]